MILLSLFFTGLSLIRRLWVSKSSLLEKGTYQNGKFEEKTHDVGANPTNPTNRTFEKGTCQTNVGGEEKWMRNKK